MEYGLISTRRLSHKSALKAPVALGVADSLKIILTTTEDGQGKRPHQAFLLLRDPKSGLEATFPFSVKDTGKAKVDVVRIFLNSLSVGVADNFSQTQKELPVQLLSSEQNLQATLLLASFGTSKPYSTHVFDLQVKHDPNVAQPKYNKPLRYGKLEEIHHIFKADPKSGPKIISLFFVLAVLATVPVLLGAVCISDLHQVILGLLTLCSGRSPEPTSLISPMPYRQPQCHTAYSSARLCLWKGSSSYTTTAGRCSRCFLLLGLWVLWHS